MRSGWVKTRQVVSQAFRGWIRVRHIRYRIAAWLALSGAFVWALMAFAAWMQSQEGKWQDAEYLALGDSTITADTLLTLLSWAFLLVAGLLGSGSVLLLRGKGTGVPLVLTGAVVVVLGQIFAAILAGIPIDAFRYSTPPHVVFATPLVIFPLTTILCMAEYTWFGGIEVIPHAGRKSLPRSTEGRR